MTVGRFKLKTPPRFVVLEDKFLPMALFGIVPLQNGSGPAALNIWLATQINK